MDNKVKTEYIKFDKIDSLGSYINLNEEDKIKLINQFQSRYQQLNPTDIIEENSIQIHPEMYDDVNRYGNIRSQLPIQSDMWDWYTNFVGEDLYIEIDYLNKTVKLINNPETDTINVQYIISRHPVENICEITDITEQKISFNLTCNITRSYKVELTNINTSETLTQNVTLSSNNSIITFENISSGEYDFKLISSDSNILEFRKNINYLDGYESYTYHIEISSSSSSLSSSSSSSSFSSSSSSSSFSSSSSSSSSSFSSSSSSSSFSSSSSSSSFSSSSSSSSSSFSSSSSSSSFSSSSSSSSSSFSSSSSLDENIPLTFTAIEADSSIKLSKTGSPTTSGLQYSLDNGNTWNEYIIDTIINLNNVNDNVQFKNTLDELSLNEYNYVHFSMTGKIKSSGNIQSLLNYSESCKPYCFYRLFVSCLSLVTAPELPSIILAKGCYDQMFRGCISLTKAPELPATILANACYLGMFLSCISLVDAPELPATTLAYQCYEQMFEGCTSLTKAPELPATILEGLCYTEMFSNCQKLNYIKVYFSEWNLVNTRDWVDYVSPSGTFVKPSSLPEEYGKSRIPEGWTVVNL